MTVMYVAMKPYVPYYKKIIYSKEKTFVLAR